MYLLCGEVRSKNRDKLTPKGDNKVMLLVEFIAYLAYGIILHSYHDIIHGLCLWPICGLIWKYISYISYFYLYYMFELFHLFYLYIVLIYLCIA